MVTVNSVRESTDTDKLLTTLDNLIDRLNGASNSLYASTERAFGPQPSPVPTVDNGVKDQPGWVNHVAHKMQRLDELIAEIETSAHSIQRLV